MNIYLNQSPPAKVPMNIHFNQSPPAKVPMNIYLNQSPPAKVPMNICLHLSPPAKVPMNIQFTQSPPAKVPMNICLNQSPPAKVPMNIHLNQSPPAEAPMDKVVIGRMPLPKGDIQQRPHQRKPAPRITLTHRQQDDIIRNPTLMANTIQQGVTTGPSLVMWSTTSILSKEQCLRFHPPASRIRLWGGSEECDPTGATPTSSSAPTHQSTVVQ
jgi:hypothetical protein